jgi:DnaJ-domain-containing protein 1
MMNLKDARTTLGVSRDCSLAELNKRYRIMALKLHPDKNGNTPEATTAFQELNEAYQTLLPGANPDANQANEANEANDDDNNADNATYSTIFMTFMKSLFKRKDRNESDRGNQVLLDLLHRIVHDYASVSVNAALDSLDPSVLFQLYETLEQYNSAVSMDARIFEEITRIIREKMQKNNIVILNPSLKDVIQNNISVLQFGGQTFYVPLWHSELHYRLQDSDEKQLIVKCMPVLPDHMSIDANNELHIDVRADIKEMLNLIPGVLRIPLYDSECVELQVRELHIQSRQTIILRNNVNGISLICATDIYDVSNKAPICVHVHLV